MVRQACCEKKGLKRGPWTMEEDHKLMNFILNNGIQCWRLVPKNAGLLRCGKSCRLRWINYLRPDLKRGAFTEAEEDMIIQLHSRLGNRWSKIAAHFPGRTDNEIKNQWNTKIKKKLKVLGIDPSTHKPTEQHENNCARKSDEQLAQPSSSTEQGNYIVSNYKILSDSKGPYNSGLDMKINVDHISKMPARLDVGSILTQKTDSCNNTFSLGMDEPIPEEDYYLEHWISSNPLSWNAFNNLN